MSEIGIPADLALSGDYALGGWDAPWIGSLSLQEPKPESEEINTGTDPRDFTNKFMPYYRYTELENDIEVQELVIFGLHAFSPRFAMTYELPITKQIDYSGFPPFQMGQGLPPGNPGSGLPSGPTPPSALEPDGDNTGMGDLILRAFSRPEALEWEYAEGKSFSIMPTLEMTLPTATDDVLGSKQFIVSPALTFVWDLPGGPPFGLGFLAGMNFFDFSTIKDNSTADTTRYRGRYFWMQPLTKPGDGILTGLYLLTEAQPIYDFETSDFSFWIGPEFGKMINPDLVIYGKPGWGIDKAPGDRDFTFEIGVRIFM